MKEADPSRTRTIRAAYEREYLRRITDLRRQVVRAVGIEDALGLASEIKTLADQPGRGRWARIPKAERLRRFGSWLRNVVDDVLINGQDLAGPIVAGGWTRTYVRRGYVHGVTRTATALKRVGRGPSGDVLATQIFNSPFHRTQLETLFERNLDELQGLGNGLGSAIKRTIAESLIRGDNPVTAARSISRQTGISRNRAKLIARTEIIRANSEASLSALEQFGETGVEVEAEWITAGDDRVCPQCAALEGKVFSIDEARGMIPLHPNCRCSYVPANIRKSQNRFALVGV